MADPGEGPVPPPLFLDQTEAPKGRKNFLGRPPPSLPTLISRSGSGTDFCYCFWFKCFCDCLSLWLDGSNSPCGKLISHKQKTCGTCTFPRSPSCRFGAAVPLWPIVEQCHGSTNYVLAALQHFTNAMDSFLAFMLQEMCKNTKLIPVRGFLKVQSCLIRIYFLGKILCDTVGICDFQALQSRAKTWHS